MRISEARELARLGARDNDGIAFADYLKDGVTRFRFPFPQEDLLDGGDNDGGDIRAMQKEHSKGFDIPAGGVEVNHATTCHHNTHKNGGHGINIFVPCPYSKEFRDAGLKTSVGGPGEQWLTVKYQAMRHEDETKTGPMSECTIFACARCEQEQRFDLETTEKIKARAREYFASYDTTGKNEGYNGGNQGLFDNAMKIIARIS